jgi:hypothetical protein
MRLIEAYSCAGYGGKMLRRQRQPLGGQFASAKEVGGKG